MEIYFIVSERKILDMKIKVHIKHIHNTRSLAKSILGTASFFEYLFVKVNCNFQFGFSHIKLYNCNLVRKQLQNCILPSPELHLAIFLSSGIPIKRGMIFLN